MIFQAWHAADNKYGESLIISTESTFDCCGLGLYDNGTTYSKPTEQDHKWSMDRNVFSDGQRCFGEEIEAGCPTCFTQLESKVEIKTLIVKRRSNKRWND